MVMNAAFLITRSKHKDFEEKVEELNTTMLENLNFRCVGPLPPYSYYTLEVKKLEFGEIDWARKKLGLLNERTTRDEIKNARKAMASSLHPDRNPNTPGMEKEFDEVTKAYRILADYSEACRQAGKEDSLSFSEEEFKKNKILVKVKD